MNKYFKDVKEIIWVYGSLREGEYNNRLLDRGKRLGRGVVRGFKMYSFGLYPFAVRTWDKNDKIIVEGYEVDWETARLIQEMEVKAGYFMVNVEVEVLKGGVTDGNIYIMDKVYRNLGEVEGGDWVKNKDVRYLGGYL